MEKKNNKNEINNVRAFRAPNSKLKRRRKAQHLVEFIIFFPFLVAITAFVIEVALAINLNLKFNSSLNEAISNVSYNYSQNLTQEEVDGVIQTQTREIFKNYNLPYSDTIGVTSVEIDDYIIVLGTYDYTIFFSLIQPFFPRFPETLYFKTAIPLNKAALGNNDFPLTTSDLDNAFSE